MQSYSGPVCVWWQGFGISSNIPIHLANELNEKSSIQTKVDCVFVFKLCCRRIQHYRIHEENYSILINFQISGHKKKLSEMTSTLNEKCKKHFGRHSSYHSNLRIAKVANLHLKSLLYKIMIYSHIWSNQNIKRIDVNIK